ncbi:helix-turn-helix domain-containing protein [Chitinophaga oryziterrae]|uniref:Helix-turn-helix domain-containing protein n=1 Tax=Chitinophaga oryziterrae TaxID=1031224 RepID=A0A6N8JHK6_9BACT|nr:helix-turn-helix transcriptional regulator [Chitinophaga oryziterrae]MVT43768.1 helix-turn-helix domain-containing protein [Chitinophaga oryziterrae]
MYLYNEEQIVPKYAFEPDSVVGNQMVRIAKGDSVTNYMKADFLIPHRKDYYFMAFIKMGSSRHWIDMTPYDLKSNTFYFTVPHQVHLKEESKPVTGMTISFSHDFLASDNNGVLKDLPIIQNPYDGHELSLSDQDLIFVEDILEKIHTEYHAKHSWQHNMLMAYMKILLIYLSRLYTEQFSAAEQLPDKVLLKRYLSKIDESYTTSHEVNAYAEMLNISAGHLSELVKEQSGKPAIMHIHERLILEAKRLLFHTDYAIKEIAYHLGFEDASYFNRFFKRLTNYTPVAYRDNFREMYH